MKTDRPSHAPRAMLLAVPADVFERIQQIAAAKRWAADQVAVSLIRAGLDATTSNPTATSSPAEKNDHDLRDRTR